MRKSLKGAIIIGIIIVYIIWYLYSNYIPFEEKTTINIISIYGTFASLIALAFTLYQVNTIKSISEETQKAVIAYKEKAEQILVISVLAQHIRYLREIQNYLSNEDYKMALSRLRDVKDYLYSMNSSNLDLIKESDPDILATLRIDIGNIEDAAFYEKEVNNRDINQNLESLITALCKIEHLSKEIKI